MSSSKIQLLNKQIKKLNAEDFDLEAWKVSVEILLTQIFGNYDPKTLAIRDLKIDYSSSMLRDSNANYQPIETCKKKGRAVLELAIDELKISSTPDSELKQLVDSGDREKLMNYLQKQKKAELIDLILK